MHYRIVRSDELYHHGVKGMKWGVRKADYNSDGMRSSNIYDRLDSLERQEGRANSENRSHYRAAKKQVRSEARARVKEAKAANKTARKEYNKSFNKAYSFSQRHAITQYIKKSKNYKKSNDNWDDAIKKAQVYKDARKNLKDVKKSAKADLKAGKAAARDVYRKNGDKITKDFDKAYAKTIGQKHIDRARATNAGLEIADIMLDRRLGIDHDSSYYNDRKSSLDYAEYRRDRYYQRKNRG